jgi:hypothetical protein
MSGTICSTIKGSFIGVSQDSKGFWFGRFKPDNEEQHEFWIPIDSESFHNLELGKPETISVQRIV